MWHHGSAEPVKTRQYIDDRTLVYGNGIRTANEPFRSISSPLENPGTEIEECSTMATRFAAELHILRLIWISRYLDANHVRAESLQLFVQGLLDARIERDFRRCEARSRSV
ncbi:hypothetical protein BDW62DRAFT_120977 [Aspergillus aurantiobrunneus]